MRGVERRRLRVVPVRQAGERRGGGRGGRRFTRALALICYEEGTNASRSLLNYIKVGPRLRDSVSLPRASSRNLWPIILTISPYDYT